MITKKTAKKGISLARDASTAKSISVDKGPTKSTTTTTTAAAAQSTTNDNGKRPHARDKVMKKIEKDYEVFVSLNNGRNPLLGFET
jgi:hypothetical protein